MTESANPPLSQHFVKASALHGRFDQLRLSGCDVLEFGAGTGVLTTHLLAQGVRSLEAWELDTTLPCPSADPRLRWEYRDILTATQQDVDNRVVVAFPPYETLPFLLDLCNAVPDVVLMVPTKRLPDAQAKGYQLLFTLTGEDFTPPARGEHHVLVKGLGFTAG